jgi:protein TonB
MGMFRRAAPWLASAGAHAVAIAAAYVTVAGMTAPGSPSAEPEAVYTVTVEPGGSSPLLADAPDLEGPGHSMEMERVPLDDAPLASIPELSPSAITFDAPPRKGGTGAAPSSTQGFSRVPAGNLSRKGAGSGTGPGIGDGTTAGVEAVPLETPSPAYPDTARRRHLEGTVVAEIKIDEKGRIESARATQGSGSPLLDDAALAAVRSWRYRPALLDGRPVASVRRVRFVFKLE